MNVGTICVWIVLIAIIALIIRGMIKDKKAGKSMMCGDCKCAGACHDGGVCPSSQMALDLAKAMEQKYSKQGEEGAQASS